MLQTEDFTIDREALTITLQRRIAAPPVRVFTAWTDPAEVTAWWDPSGKPLADCQIDLRPGGQLKFVNEGAQHAFEGVWRLIDPPHQLSFDAMGARGDLTFAADGAGTKMTLVMTCTSPDHLDQFIRMGVADGTAQTLRNLAAHLAA